MPRTTCCSPPIRIRQANRQGWIECPPGAIFDASYPDSQLRRGRVQDGGKLSPTITAKGAQYLWLYEGTT